MQINMTALITIMLDKSCLFFCKQYYCPGTKYRGNNESVEKLKIQ